MDNERLKFITREAINIAIGVLNSIYEDNHTSNIKECIGITEEEWNYIYDEGLPPEVEYTEEDFDKCL